MEIWTVVGVDTKATDVIKSTGEKVAGIKLHVTGSNFDPDQDRYLGDCVSVIFISHATRQKLQYDPMPGARIQVAYDRWGRVTFLQPA